MDAELKKKWVAALRSGKYEQGVGQFCTADRRFCCLGVLADVSGATWDDNGEAFLDGESVGIFLFLDRALERFGIPDEAQCDLSNRNDGNGKYSARQSFEQIAGHIEAHL